MRRAVRNRWPITEAIRKQVVEFASDLLEGRARARDKIAAAKVLLDADKINVAEMAALKKDHPPGPTNVTVNVDARQQFNLDPAAFAEFEEEVLGIVAADDQAESLHPPSANGKAAAIPPPR